MKWFAGAFNLGLAGYFVVLYLRGQAEYSSWLESAPAGTPRYQSHAGAVGVVFVLAGIGWFSLLALATLGPRSLRLVLALVSLCLSAGLCVLGGALEAVLPVLISGVVILFSELIAAKSEKKPPVTLSDAEKIRPPEGP